MLLFSFCILDWAWCWQVRTYTMKDIFGWPHADCFFPFPCVSHQNVTPATYIATHRTDPPPNQVITTEPRNILLRHFYQKSEEKLRPKRAAPDNLAPENNNKQPRGPVADVGSQSNARSWIQLVLVLPCVSQCRVQPACCMLAEALVLLIQRATLITCMNVHNNLPPFPPTLVCYLLATGGCILVTDFSKEKGWLGMKR